MAPANGSASPARPKTRSNTLRQAASAVFAVTAIVPLLILVWTLYYLGALFQLQAQVGLGLALGIALLGFHIFRRLMGQMSDLILALGKAVASGARSAANARAGGGAPGSAVPPTAGAWARAAAAPGAPAAPRPAAEPVPSVATEHPSVTPAPAAPSPASPPAPAPAAEPAGQPAVVSPHVVPGLGAIQEVHDLNRAMVVLWQAEAAPHKGRRVAVSVMNSPPINGTLIELTDDGLLVETDGAERVAVSYHRISAIDVGHSPAEK